VIVGTAGHVDHGKSSLVRAITGVDPDRLKEEKERGITIDLGFAYWTPPDSGTIGFVDVPGHERFVHTMLAGANGIDVVLLVVAADDGVMPQTREHLAIVELLGLTRGLVALTKLDLVDASRRLTVEADIRRLLASGPLADVPIMPVSTVTGAGLPALGNELTALARGVDRQRPGSRFRLAVDRCFTLTGAGTVVTGTVLSGAVATGDRLVVSPSGLEARVRAIHAQNRATERSHAGDRCALNIAGPGVARDAIRRGDMVVDPHLHAPMLRVDAEVRVLPGDPKGLGLWMPVRLHHGSAEVGARVVLLSDAAMAPGAAGRVQLVLERPVAACVSDRFVIRDTTGARTIGGGRFLDLRPPERRRRSPDRLVQLDALALSDPVRTLDALLRLPPFHVDFSAFIRDRAFDEDAAHALAEALSLIRLPVGERIVAMAPTLWLKLRRNVGEELTRFHADNPDLPGQGLERLRLSLDPRLPVPVFKAASHALQRLGDVALDGAWMRLPGHVARLSEADERLWACIAPMLDGAERTRPPRVRDIAAALGERDIRVRKLLKLVGRRGQVDEVAEDHFFLREAVAEMVAIASDLAASAPGGEFNAAAFRDRLEAAGRPTGRRLAILILEFLDRHGVTIRRDDLRRINRHRLDLFATSGQALSN